jgi:hypothetical protein
MLHAGPGIRPSAHWQGHEVRAGGAGGLPQDGRSARNTLPAV